MLLRVCTHLKTNPNERQFDFLAAGGNCSEQRFNWMWSIQFDIRSQCKLDVCKLTSTLNRYTFQKKNVFIVSFSLKVYYGVPNIRTRILYNCIIFATDIEVCNRRRISTSVTTTSIKVQAHYYRCHQYYSTITTKVFVVQQCVPHIY